MNPNIISSCGMIMHEENTEITPTWEAGLQAELEHA
jgi:hypothetical protein